MERNMPQILLVEDHADTAYALGLLLRSASHNVTMAATLSHARKLARTFRFDFLICDIGLPDGDGCDLLEELRQLYPIDGIVLSGFASPDDIDRAKTRGYAEHIAKPAAFERLL